MPDWIQTVNWKTTGYAIGFFICKALGRFYPELSDVCSILETILVGAGFISAADSTRVQSIVRAVDALAWKNKLDPAMLVPIESMSEPTKEPLS
jgi:hypothetical protein